MSTLTDEDLTILESLEFEPACEHSQHGTKGGSGPAEWAVFRSPVGTCGCPRPPLVLWCSPCKDRVMHSPFVLCHFCLLPKPHDIERIEPLR